MAAIKLDRAAFRATRTLGSLLELVYWVAHPDLGRGNDVKPQAKPGTGGCGKEEEPREEHAQEQLATVALFGRPWCVSSAGISGAFHLFLLIKALTATESTCSLVNFIGALTQDLKCPREGWAPATLGAGWRSMIS